MINHYQGLVLNEILLRVKTKSSQKRDFGRHEIQLSQLYISPWILELTYNVFNIQAWFRVNIHIYLYINILIYKCQEAWAEWPGGCIGLLALVNEDRHSKHWAEDLDTAERKTASFPGKRILKWITLAMENFFSCSEEKLYHCSVHRYWVQRN